MDVGIYSQIALGLPLTTMQASSRHPSHRARRGLLGHPSICVSFRIVCHIGACRVTDLLPNKVAGSIHVFSTLSSPGKFQSGTSPALPRLTVDRPWRFSFSGPINKSGFRLVAFYLEQQTFTWRWRVICPLCPMRMRMALSQASTT